MRSFLSYAVYAVCWRGAGASCGCDATGGDCACGCPRENADGVLGVAKAGVGGADVAVLLIFVLGPKRLSMSSIAAARCGAGEGEDVLVTVAEGSAPKILAKMSSLLVGLGADVDEISSPRRSAYRQGRGEYNCQSTTYNIHP